MLAHSKKGMEDGGGGGCNDTLACLKEPSVSSSTSDGPFLEKPPFYGYYSQIHGNVLLVHGRVWIALFHLCCSYIMVQ